MWFMTIFLGQEACRQVDDGQPFSPAPCVVTVRDPSSQKAEDQGLVFRKRHLRSMMDTLDSGSYF